MLLHTQDRQTHTTTHGTTHRQTDPHTDPQTQKVLLHGISTLNIPQLYGSFCDADLAMDMVFDFGLTEFGMLRLSLDID